MKYIKKLTAVVVAVLIFFSSCSVANDTAAFVSGDQLRVICLGDSVTAGVFEVVRTGSYFFGGYVYDVEAAYPALLESLLREAGYDARVINAGVSGDTVGRGLSRLEDDVIAHDPDVVTVCFGLNDVCLEDPDMYATCLGDLFDSIRRRSEAKIIFMTPNMLATYIHPNAADDYVNRAMAEGNVYITESGMLDVYMERAREVCAEYGIPVCDAYARWKEIHAGGGDVTELLASYVTHPNRDMQRLFADMIAEAMRESNIIS